MQLVRRRKEGRSAGWVGTLCKQHIQIRSIRGRPGTAALTQRNILVMAHISGN